MLDVSKATVSALELPALLAVTAQFCATAPGRAFVLELEPTSDDELDRKRACFEEARVQLVDGPLVGALDADVPLLLERVGDPRAVLDAPDVLAAADLLRLVARAAHRVTAKDATPSPRLAELVAPLPDSRPWTRRVEQILDARGRVRDDASPKLATLRGRVGKLRQRIYSELQGSVAEYGRHLSEETIPLHEGRLVLLLKSGARGQIDGLVHGRSGSGRSFYFEPLSAVEGNNRLREAIDDESAERARLLAELLDGLRELAPTLVIARDVLAELDALQAAGRYAERVGARLAELAGGELRLVAARHPLLDPALAGEREAALGSVGHREPVVPLDLELGGDGRMLVITGPNAGGKTVALKTAGLLTLATACGLPVPCDRGSRVPRLARLVATVGDEQDLLHDRSTFSARLLRLREAWDAAGADSLVLLDELGSGTDPDEGAALAIALLEQLHTAGTLTLVTTHLSRLASLALDTNGAVCAAMEFDPEAGRPTFRLRRGTPGASEALALATRLGLPPDWIERATAELDPEQQRLQSLLEEVERERAELGTRLAQTTELQEQLEAGRSEVAAQREAAERERKLVAKRLRSRLAEFEQEVREKLVDSEATLRQQLAAGEGRGAGARMAAELLAEAPDELEEEAPVEAGPLVVGGAVRHRGLGWEGRLERLARGKAEVSVRGKTMRCRDEDLVAVVTEPPPARTGRARAVATPPVPEVAEELHLIGQRVETALDEVDRYLDRALLSNRDSVRIVHGHGSGRLRRAVREHLAAHRAVAAHRAGGDGEGGDGATVVTLRE